VHRSHTCSAPVGTSDVPDRVLPPAIHGHQFPDHGGARPTCGTCVHNAAISSGHRVGDRRDRLGTSRCRPPHLGPLPQRWNVLGGLVI
jgi:hypothetical protein